MPEPIVEKKQLREHPSVRRWSVELGRVISGERESEVRHKLTADRYVSQFIGVSVDPVRSRTFFVEALRRAVDQWHPSAQKIVELMNMLDLLKAYRPEAGFAPVLRFAQSGEAANLPPVIRGMSTQVDIQMELLIVLYYYFETPPPSSTDNAGYNQYIRVLKKHCLDPEFGIYSGYALGRLLELGEIKLHRDSGLMEAAFKWNAAALTSVLNVVLSQNYTQDLTDYEKNKKLDRDVSYLIEAFYRGCTSNAKLFDLRLREVLEPYNANLSYTTSSGLEIEFSGEFICRLTGLPRYIVDDILTDCREKVDSMSGRLPQIINSLMADPE